MSSLYNVLKVNIINSIGINKILKYGSKEERVKTIATIAMISIVILIISVMPFIYASLIADMLTKSGLLDLILVIAIVGSSAFTFFTSIYKAQGVLFVAKDYEILMSLPIKQSVILTSKMIQLLLLNYLCTALILIPTSIIYFIRVDMSSLFFLYLLIAFIFVPLVPIVAASIIAFMLSYISSKVRFKNLFLTLGSFTVLILIMGLTTKMNNLIEIVTANSKSIIDGIGRIYPIGLYFTNSLINLDVFSLLKLILASVVPFIIFLFVFSKFYNNINSKLGESFKSSNYKLTTLKITSPIRALIRKEIKGYFSSPIYVLNTSFGVVLITIGSIASLLFGGDIIGNILNIPESKEILPILMMGALTLCVCMSCTTNSSISLEGKRLWILKSSPIDVMDIFKGKIAVNLLILIPIILLNSIVLLISLKMNLINFIWMIIIPSLYSLVVSIGGVLINLYFPKLEWVSETAVIKQSLSAMVAPLAGIIIVAIPVGVLILFKITNNNLYLAVVSIALIVVILLLWTLLKKIGQKLFSKL